MLSHRVFNAMKKVRSDEARDRDWGHVWVRGAGSTSGQGCPLKSP